VKVKIACFASTTDGHVLDIETGCSTPQEAPQWVFIRRNQGADPSVYVNESNWPATQSAFHAAGVAEPHYWLALYDGIATVPPGTVAKQYANSAITSADYDMSIVADFWPGVDTVRQGGLAMPGFMRSADPNHMDAHGTGSVYLLDGNRKLWVPSPPPPLDGLRYVTQLASVHHISPDITPVDNAVLDLIPEGDAAVTIPKSFSGTVSGSLS